MLSVSREAIAGAYKFNHRKVIFKIGDQHEVSGPGSEPPLDAEGWWGGAKSEPRPDAALLRRLWQQNSKDYRPCGAWFALLRQTGSGVGEAEVTAMVSQSRKNNRGFDAYYPREIVTLSRPVVAVDGMTAVLETSGVSAPLGGGGFVVGLRRTDKGEWRETAYRQLWIS